MEEIIMNDLKKQLEASTAAQVKELISRNCQMQNALQEVYDALGTKQRLCWNISDLRLKVVKSALERNKHGLTQ
jgi:hypothetical protein